MKRIRIGVIGLLIAWIVSVCLQEPSIGQAIIGGSAVSKQEQEDKGLVIVDNICSGVLLANDWVLTAGHCISNNRDPYSVEVLAAWGESTNYTRTSDALYQFANYNDSRGVDLALVHLSAPFIVHGSTSGFINQWNFDPHSALLNQTVASYGAGLTMLPLSGFGNWRAADLKITKLEGETFSYVPNDLGQVIAPGDSGGPDFIFQNGVPRITGIHSGASWKCSNNTTPATCKSTITEILSGFSISIPAVHERMSAVLKTEWHPTMVSHPIWVYQGEINGTRWGFVDVDKIHWAQAARSAAAMCYNRGFESGHFDGHQDIQAGGYGIQCSSRGTFVTDVTAADIASTGWGFSDINTVVWAQANRAAERLCARYDRGFAGGHFNGHMLDGLYGLVCYRDGARWFDATDSEIAATGWGFPVYQLDDVLWTQAARAAVGFCRNKGFSGGFMNGHQVPGRYGVVCQGDAPPADPMPTLMTNYTTVAPGSYLTLTGKNFPAHSSQTVAVNGKALFTTNTDAAGTFQVILDTDHANDGAYRIATAAGLAATGNVISSAVQQSSTIALALSQQAHLFEQENSGTVFDLLTGQVVVPQPSPTPIPRLHSQYLPYIQR